MSRPWPRRGARVLLLLLVTGCVQAWQPLPSPTPDTLGARAIVEVRDADGRRLRLHGVRFEGDSLSGVPTVRPPDCDSCRVRVSAAARRTARVAEVGDRRVGELWLFALPFAVALWLVTGGSD
ncbi:MAG TPA: hypothetical protein VFN90_09465 [Gemmatimonadales bacterium]|nr:hypothetical protein [Gemmatimonadales bacterium]